MKLPVHTSADYADAQRSLLPPGAAFEWPQGGFGDNLLKGVGEETARLGAGAQQVLDTAIEQHRPKYNNWHISEYRRIAIDAVSAQHPTPTVTVDHLVGPFRVGSNAGQRVWGTGGRSVIRVRYNSVEMTLATLNLLKAALEAFKQAHVYLWFDDIAGV